MWHEWPRKMERVLAVRLDNVGDVVLLDPALRALKHASGARVTLLCSPGGVQAAPLLPDVDDTIEARVSWQDISGTLAATPRGDAELIARLASEAFDAAVVFTSFSQSSHPPAYACYLAGIPARAAHSASFAGAVLTHAVEPPAFETHQAERNLHLLRGLGISADDPRPAIRVPPESAGRAGELLGARGVGERYALVVPGAGCSARRYPAAAFAEVVRLLAEDRRDVVVAGGPRERELVAKVACASPSAVALAGETTVPEFAALIAEAGVVVANDSAAMHVADALGTPVVAAFSGTDLVSQWTPRFSPAAVLTCPAACAPCYGQECPRQKECLEIPPAEVVAAALRMWGMPRPAPGGPALADAAAGAATA